jgi:uncharacterized protein (AIM24 family)
VWYRVVGDDIQVAEFLLLPGQRVQFEPNAFVASVGGIAALDVHFGRRMRDLYTRGWAGESVILDEAVCQESPGLLTLGSPRGGAIVRLPVRDGRSIYAQRGAFLAATGQIDISIAMIGTAAAGLLGGNGIVLQRIHGNGDVFLEAHGRTIDWDLEAGVMARVATSRVLAFEDSIGYDVQFAKGLTGNIFSVGNRFMVQLEGPGRVLVQSQESSHTKPRTTSRRETTPTTKER